MPDHTKNAGIIYVSSSICVSEREDRVKDVQSLIFHGAHIEIVDGDDVEH